MIDLTHPNPDLHFINGDAACPTCSVVSNSGDVTVSYSAAGATLGEPAKVPGEGFRRDLGDLITNFSVVGDFTATVTYDASHFGPLDVFGPNPSAAFTFFGGGDNGGIFQTLSGPSFGTIAGCTPICSQEARAAGLGSVFTISRAGSVVALTGGPASNPDANVYRGSGYSTDPFHLVLQYEGNNLDIADYVTFESLAITADGFQGLAAVPEPGTWLLMCLGLFGLGAALRSRAARATA